MRVFSASAAAATMALVVWPAFGAGQDEASRTIASREPGQRVSADGCVVREADYAEAHGLARLASPGTTSAQFILVAKGGDYSLTGEQEAALAPYVNTGVEVSGIVEPAAAPTEAAPARTSSSGTATPSGTAGVQPRGAAAHEPGDAVPGTQTGRTAADGVDPAASRPVATSDLPRINVVTFRASAVSCAEALPRASTPEALPAPQAPSVPAPPEVTARQESVIVTGCLTRQDASDGTPGRSTSGSAGLLLMKATMARNAPATRPSAVPGSTPTGGNTGTVGTSGVQPPASSVADELGFVLDSVPSALEEHVGRRVEISGVIEAESTAPADRAPTAHVSAPERTLVVKSFRVAAGGCS